VIYLDTHAAVALYQAELSAFSAAALKELEEESDLRVSPMVLLELEYLQEIKRIRIPAAQIVSSLGAEIGLTVCDLPFPQVIRQAIEERWTRDPFDRIIVAHAKANEAVLITRDRAMLRRYSRAMG
jgi:PIN domain nuclease of toxin-antitoxin system